jgi:hypothetical protein
MVAPLLPRAWGTKEECERRKRIKLTLWSYAYEIAERPIATDAQFDALSARIDLTISTGRDDLDSWWRSVWSAHTGMWIHQHPELDKVRELYERHINDRENS